MKRFLIKLSYTILPMWLFTLAAVAYYYEGVVPYQTGDIGILGKIPFGKFYNYDVVSKNRLPQTLRYTLIEHPDSLKNHTADVLTVGDTFSQAKEYGYQNFLADEDEMLSVANYCPIVWTHTNPIQTAYDLLKLGYADSAHYKTMVVQTAERWLVLRLDELKTTNKSLEADHFMKKTKGTPTDDGWSIHETRNYLYLRLKIKEPIYEAKLDRKLFSSPRGDELYFIDTDHYLLTIDDNIRQKLKASYDSLTALAKEKHVKLLFLVCPDKYDIYQDFIVGEHPKKTINEDFRTLIGNDSNLIIAKEQLLPLVNKGEKDIFFMNDTHWSCKSAAIMAKELARHISRR